MQIRTPGLQHILAVSACIAAACSLCATAGATQLVPAPAPKPIVKANISGTPPKPVLTQDQAAQESEHIARFDAAIAQVRKYEVSADDAQRIREAIAALSKDVEKAREIAKEIRDPAGRKLVEWYRLRSGLADPFEIEAFLANNPAWPDRALLTRRFEELLFARGGSAQAIKQAFSKSAPTTGLGWAALASAHLVEGDHARAKEFAVRAWREHAIPAEYEAAFLQRFGGMLSEADHKWRLDRILIDDPRWSSDRKAKAAAAKRVIRLLSAPEQKKAEARLAVFERSKSASKLLAAIGHEATVDWGLAFQRVVHLRRHGKDEEAWKILLSAPTDPAEIVNPDGWWEQRRGAAYDALKAGKAKLAFELVRDAGPLGANPRNEQTFLAGWLALRHLKKPSVALPFFEENVKGADGPLSRSRGLYWLARTHKALGNRKKAQEYFKAAAEYQDTFHSHLAREELGKTGPKLVIRPPKVPSAEQIAAFNRLDAVQAAVIAGKVGLDRHIQRAFINGLQQYFQTEGEVALVAHLAQALGDTQLALRVGKAGVARGMNLIYYSYPIHALPAYKPLRTPPETALLLGLARQESEFGTHVVSGAGARGILQVMPGTARHICRQYKIKCSTSQLTSDPSHNLMLASAYVADRLDYVDGSYILALTSYNAGPGRTRQWLRELGDPRDPSVDPIDWIYQIPFDETRDYVQKVLSNVQVYRARLGQKSGSIMADLVRARRKPTQAP